MNAIQKLPERITGTLSSSQHFSLFFRRIGKSFNDGPFSLRMICILFLMNREEFIIFWIVHSIESGQAVNFYRSDIRYLRFKCVQCSQASIERLIETNVAEGRNQIF